MPLEPRQEIAGLTACYHGGLVHTELEKLGLKAEEVIDFSVSSNPFSYPSAVAEAACKAVINRYPDSESTELRERLTGQLGVPIDSILVGAGSMEIIRLITLAYFGSNDSVLILKPTFGEYELAVQIAGAKVIELWSKEANDFAFNIDETISVIKEKKPKGVFICNPNNPSGQYLTQNQVEKVLAACEDSLLVLDEAYIAFTEGAWPSAGFVSKGKLVIVRSMTKDYALAGLRLGYAVASPEIIGNLKRVCPPWNVNAVAQAAGLAALADEDYLKQCEVKIRRSKNYLTNELDKMDFKLLPSRTNFFLVKVGNGSSFRAKLLKYGLMLRDCTSFGLPEYVRIAALSISDCQKLIATIRTLKDREEA